MKNIEVRDEEVVGRPTVAVLEGEVGIPTFIGDAGEADWTTVFPCLRVMPADPPSLGTREKPVVKP
jgi:hypothetical protein